MRSLKWKAVLSFFVIAITGLCIFGCGGKGEEVQNGNKKEEIGKEKIGERDSGKEDSGKEDSGKEDTGKQDEAEENPDDTAPIRAVYLKNDQGGLFVNLDNETPFTGTIPDEILDEEGQVLSEDSMENGDVFLIYGNGIMMESYPGQYPGITKLERKESSNQEYAEKYQELMEQIFPKPDTSQPPQLSVEYRQPDAVVTVNITRGSYEWNVEKENGETESTIADSAHILEWKDELIDLTLAEDTELTLWFERNPQSIEVVCWPVSERREAGTSEGYPEGEPVEVSETEEGFCFTGKPDQVYRVEASWEQGKAEYGFYTVKK